MSIEAIWRFCMHAYYFTVNWNIYFEIERILHPYTNSPSYLTHYLILSYPTLSYLPTSTFRSPECHLSISLSPPCIYQNTNISVTCSLSEDHTPSALCVSEQAAGPADGARRNATKRGRSAVVVHGTN